MAEYRVEIARSATRELDRLPRQIADRILPRIKALADNPRPLGSKNCEAAKIIYAVTDDERVVSIRAIRPRSTAYD